MFPVGSATHNAPVYWLTLVGAGESHWPGINSPLASSAGRLFDAVAAALGCVADQQTWEGKQLVALRRWLCSVQACGTAFPYPWRITRWGWLLSGPLFWRWMQPWQKKHWVFHDALAQGFAQLALQHARAQNISTIACAGGVFHNQLFRQRLQYWLGDYHVLFPHALPAGDGALSWGQALVAAARLQG
ncbi:hypothetical protein ABC733_25150 [Mangrovibacter sp. SLW1]